MTEIEAESLFSFEVAVKTIFLKRAVTCRVPSVAIRLLEYPTLELKLLDDEELCKIRNLVESDPETIVNSPQILELQHSTGTYAFTLGKSCLIKLKLSDLEENLCNIPVYIMVLDMLPSVPKHVASFALSLESSIRKIVRDVSVNGIETPCAQGERDVFPLFNLMGNKVGEAEMGVRISSLGINMLQHVKNITKPESANHFKHDAATNGKNVLKRVTITEIPHKGAQNMKQNSVLKSPKHSTTVVLESDENKENFVMKEKKKMMVSGSTQTMKRYMPSKSIQHPLNEQVEDLGITDSAFCPPALYYDTKSDALEKELYQKQKSAIAHHVEETNRSIRLADLQNDGHMMPSSVIYQSATPRGRRVSQSHSTNTGLEKEKHIYQFSAQFPILSALVAEVTRLGLDENGHAAPDQEQPTEAVKKPSKNDGRQKLSQQRSAKQRSTILHRIPIKQLDRTREGPLKFGLTNTLRLRMAKTKANIKQQKEKNSFRPTSSKDTLQQPLPPSLGRTYAKSAYNKEPKRIQMVSTACGPDGSMYRRPQPTDIQQHSVYMGRVPGYEEATDLDIPSMGHMTSNTPPSQAQHKHLQAENEAFGIEDLMIVKDIGTPRAHSRQSQRSIEIHLPTASTEFTIGKDDDGDWESTFSDKENLVKKIWKAKKLNKREKWEFCTSSESSDASRPELALEDRTKKKMRLSEDHRAQSDISISERFKYSDDFDDDKTWSPTRTPSATMSVKLSAVINEGDEEEIPARPSMSMDSNVTMTSDFTNSAGEEVIKRFDELKSANARKISSSDETYDSSSMSRGSVVTALMPAGGTIRNGKVKVGSTTVPEPIPSDSPIIQSINTESGSMERFPEPKKGSLTTKSALRKDKLSEASATKDVHFLRRIGNSKTSKSQKAEPPAPKSSRFTPSPPLSRRFSPLSSPESSKERMRRKYHHPGRHTRPTSSGSGSSEFDKPPSPVRRSDSVSSYHPSELSDVSNLKFSEELDNLSDILSEETDSQVDARSFKMKNMQHKDGPKTYFGKPKVDPSAMLGYTT